MEMWAEVKGRKVPHMREGEVKGSKGGRQVIEKMDESLKKIGLCNGE